MSTTHKSPDLDRVFAPESIAIVGASALPGTIGLRCVDYLQRHGYSGRIYPINPKYREVAGLRCYHGLDSLPGEVDQVLICVSRKLALSALAEAHRRGARSAVVLSSGYGETGPEGQKDQAELVAFAREHGMRVLGPNCAGYVNARRNVWNTFSAIGEHADPVTGGAAIISQSGALGGSLVNRAWDRGLGLSHFISTGNEADLNTGEVLEWLAGDPETQLIMAFLEGIHDPAAFVRGLQAARQAGKPVIVMKVGNASGSAQAAASHTGAIVGDDAVYDALFRAMNVIRVEDTDEIIDTALLAMHLPACEGVGLLTTSGGLGSLMAFQADRLGLVLPPISPDIGAALTRVMPDFSTIHNPLDTTAQSINDPDMYVRSLTQFARDPAFGIVIAAITTAAGKVAEGYAANILRAARETGKPMASVWTAGSLSEPGIRMLQAAGAPVFHTPLSCLKAIRNVMAYARRRTRNTAESLAPVAADYESITVELPEQGVLTERPAKLVLSRFGLPVVRERAVQSVDQAVIAGRELGFPVVLKIDADGLAHKTEVGGVLLGLRDAGEVREGYHTLVERVRERRPDLQVRGVLVQEMVPPGTEMLLGSRRDPQFGAVVTLGLGGVWVEALRDISTRLVPITPVEADSMIRELRGYPVLAGGRGMVPRDLAALRDAIVAMSRAAEALGDAVSEIEVNPLIVLPEGQGARVVDALIIPKNRMHSTI